MTTPPRAVPSSFVRIMPVMPAAFKLTRLIERVLPGRRVEHKQHLDVAAGRLALDHARDFRQLVHEVFSYCAAGRPYRR